MKVALVHDYIKEYGGAERVLEAICEIYPDADIYTSVYLPEFLGPHKERFKKLKIHTSWAQRLPFKAKLISPIRLITPFLFKSFDFSNYDLIITSATGAYSPNILNKKNAKLICYSHTPPRYLYGYETARDWRNNPFTRILGSFTIKYLRKVDLKSSQNVDYFIANSEETKKRIEKFYGKTAKVIYPPVNILLDEKVEKGNYFIAGGRMARAKHTDLIVKAFIKNNLPIKIFGKGFAGFEEEIRELAKDKASIEFVGEVSDLEKERLIASSKAFIFASKDEDFGIVPVEAMMLGVPVIAHKSGGVLETVEEGKTGIFFDDLTIESLNNAINKLEKAKFYSSIIRDHAKRFRKDRFEREIREFVRSVI